MLGFLIPSELGFASTPSRNPGRVSLIRVAPRLQPIGGVRESRIHATSRGSCPANPHKHWGVGIVVERTTNKGTHPVLARCNASRGWSHAVSVALNPALAARLLAVNSVLKPSNAGLAGFKCSPLHVSVHECPSKRGEFKSARIPTPSLRSQVSQQCPPDAGVKLQVIKTADMPLLKQPLGHTPDISVRNR